MFLERTVISRAILGKKTLVEDNAQVLEFVESVGISAEPRQQVTSMLVSVQQIRPGCGFNIT